MQGESGFKESDNFIAMADVHTKAQRRYNMQQIKSGNTKPELLVRKFLFAPAFIAINNQKVKTHPRKSKIEFWIFGDRRGSC